MLDSKIPLFYDGFKCYVSTSKPTEDEFDRGYPQLKLTSPLSYEPEKRDFTQHQRANNVDNVKERCTKLGYSTMEVVNQTLECTTCLVDTFKAESREYHTPNPDYYAFVHIVSMICLFF